MTDLPTETVKELLNQIAQGSDKAFTRLYQHYHGFVYAYARSQLRDNYEAENLAHEVFMVELKKPQGFSGGSSYSTWLVAIAKRKIFDWIAEKKIERSLFDSDSDEIDLGPDPQGDVVHMLELKQDMAALHYCIDKLPPKQREWIFYLYFADCTYVQTAANTDTAVGSVKSGVNLVVTRLHRCLTRWIKGGRDA